MQLCGFIKSERTNKQAEIFFLKDKSIFFISPRIPTGYSQNSKSINWRSFPPSWSHELLWNSKGSDYGSAEHSSIHSADCGTSDKLRLVLEINSNAGLLSSSLLHGRLVSDWHSKLALGKKRTEDYPTNSDAFDRHDDIKFCHNFSINKLTMREGTLRGFCTLEFAA